MEARQSAPVCAPIGLLLLLIGLGCSPLPEVQGRPIDFWCNEQHRTDMLKMTEALRKRLADCVDTLPAPVQLPCASIQTAVWKNKTAQQKTVEVMGAIRVYDEVVPRERNQSSACQKTLLMLRHRINNYKLIVKSVFEQNVTSQAAVDCCSSVNSLKEVLDNFVELLKKKLETLAFDLKQSMCNGGQGTSNGR